MSSVDPAFATLVKTWCAAPTAPRQNYRWVINKSSSPTQIEVVPITNFTDAQKPHARLRDVFNFMRQELSRFNTTTVLHTTADALKELREKVTQKFEKHWDYRCIFARIWDIFLSFFGCSCALGTAYKRLIKEIDKKTSDGILESTTKATAQSTAPANQSAASQANNAPASAPAATSAVPVNEDICDHAQILTAVKTNFDAWQKNQFESQYLKTPCYASIRIVLNGAYHLAHTPRYFQPGDNVQDFLIEAFSSVQRILHGIPNTPNSLIEIEFISVYKQGSSSNRHYTVNHFLREVRKTLDLGVTTSTTHSVNNSDIRDFISNYRPKYIGLLSPLDPFFS